MLSQYSDWLRSAHLGLVPDGYFPFLKPRRNWLWGLPAAVWVPGAAPRFRMLGASSTVTRLFMTWYLKHLLSQSVARTEGKL